MAVYKKMTITLHPIEIEKLERIAKQNKETKSGMIARLIQEYPDVKRSLKKRLIPGSKEYEDVGDLTELSYDLRGQGED